MADSPYRTLSNIRSAVLTDFKESTNAIVVAQVTRWANEAVENWTLRKKRDFLNKTFHITLEPYVSTTWQVTNGSSLVTKVGTGSIPVTSLNEHKFRVQGFQEIYDVSALSATTLTLASPFQGTTNSVASGVFFQSSVYVDPAIRSIHKVYHEFFSFPLQNYGAQDLQDEIQKDPYNYDYAQAWTLKGLDVDAGATHRRLVIYPFPKLAYTLHIDANVYITPMSADSDEPPVPLQYRQFIYWYCMAKMALYHGDFEQAQSHLSTYNVWLQKLDGELMPEREYPQIKNSQMNRWIGRTQRGRAKIRFE
jgi:hypothetical protein